jgi:adenosylhomocysteine nucleosidase
VGRLWLYVVRNEGNINLQILSTPFLRLPDAAVIVSADAEWPAVRSLFPQAEYLASPFGEYFHCEGGLVFHGGWGKIAAAASTQYVIDRWNPDTIINLGTCGGIAGAIDRFSIVLATRTVVYDIGELMGDSQEAIGAYSTDIDLDWLDDETPTPVIRSALLSADRDLVPEEIAVLQRMFEVKAVDWESGAIAWVATRNRKRVLILRGVTDLVGPAGGEVYGNAGAFAERTATVMKRLFDVLPLWVERLKPA